MGSMHILKCTHCNYNNMIWSGVGFAFQEVANKILADMKKGKYGEEFKKDALNSRSSAVNHSMEVFVCSQCGEIEEKELIKLHVYVTNPQFKENGGLDSNALNQGTSRTMRIVKTVEYNCKKCSGKMHPCVDLQGIKCPICGEILSVEYNVGNWD